MKCFFCQNTLDHKELCPTCSTNNMQVFTTYDDNDSQCHVHMYFYQSKIDSINYKYQVVYSLESDKTYIFTNPSNQTIQKIVCLAGCPIKPNNGWNKLSTILTFL